jgi:microcystin-dependent protein
MSCTNCFNGCAETISDQCVRYTGEDIPALGISHGDSLLAVENAITAFLVPVLTGVGIKPIVNDNVICDVVKQFLPTCTQCTGFTLNEVLTAIIKAACLLQEQIDDLVAEFETLNANYDVACLDGVTASSGTHDILQAAIDKICELEVNLGAVILDLATNYYTKTQVIALIENYVPPGGNLVKNKMIPYVAVPFFSTDLSMFDVSGAGIGDWIDIYLCNGSSHPQAPDIRGRVLVGVTTGVPGGPMDSNVVPNMGTGGFNPSYTLNTIYGNNSVTLGVTQMPTHTHIIDIIDPDHNHFVAAVQGGTLTYPANAANPITAYADYGNTGSYRFSSSSLSPTVGPTSSSPTGITATAQDAGSGLPHSNIQPVLACNYIIYIP